MIRVLVGPLASMVVLSLGCRSGRVVSDGSFRYANMPTEAILAELGPNAALDVLEDLGRLKPTSEDGASGEQAFATQVNSKAKSMTVRELKQEGFVSASIDSDSRYLRFSSDGKSDTLVERDRSVKDEPVYKAGPYFSTLTAIAVEEGLDPTAIPGLAVGYRPDFSKVGLDSLNSLGVGFDLFIGGAVSPGGDSSGDVELALGAGLTFPWSDAGAFSLGVATWRTEDSMTGDADTQVAFYFGINLGTFNVASGGE